MSGTGVIAAVIYLDITAVIYTALKHERAGLICQMLANILIAAYLVKAG